MRFKVDFGRSKEVILVAAIYFACAAAALRLTRFDGGLAIVWIAGAVLFAKLAVTPRHRWVPIVGGCGAAAIAAAYLFGFAGTLSAVLACVGVAEATVAALLVKRVYPRFGRFETLRETIFFLIVGGVLSPATAGLIAGLSVHWIGGMPFWSAWRDWFAGHTLGLIVFAPPLILTLRGMRGLRHGPVDRKELIEAALLLGAVFVAASVTFGQNEIPLVILPVVPMVAATFRLGRAGAVASILIVVAIGLACSFAGKGPTTLLHASMGAKFQVLQIYFACLVLILLPVAAELSARRRLMQRLVTAEALHRLILDRTSDVVLRLTTDGTVQYTSPFVTNAWGYTTEYLKARSIFDFIHADDAANVKLARTEIIAEPEETRTVEYRILRANGSTIWVESHMRATTDRFGKVTGTVSIIREITEKRQAIEDLAISALTDALTGLYNRRAFNKGLVARLNDPLLDERPGCVAMFDLDHFKRINDQYGHATGDVILKRFASVLSSSVRDGDLAARLGGEEFAVLFVGANVGQAYFACDRIRERFASCEEFSNSGQVIRATVSVGITQLVRGTSAEAQLASADSALYQAKNAGRNQLAVAA